MADYKLPRVVEFVEIMPETIPLWKRMDSAGITDITPEG
jgi:hypothetical protein